MPATKTELQRGAIQALRRCLKPGSTVYCVLDHESISGMSRRIKFLIAEHVRGHKPTISDISWYVAQATGYRFNRDHHAVLVGGCGMDMGFAVVYDLGSVLWPKGTRKPHGWRNGEPDHEGGYALKHSWL